MSRDCSNTLVEFLDPYGRTASSVLCRYADSERHRRTGDRASGDATSRPATMTVSARLQAIRCSSRGGRMAPRMAPRGHTVHPWSRDRALSVWGLSGTPGGTRIPNLLIRRWTHPVHSRPQPSTANGSQLGSQRERWSASCRRDAEFCDGLRMSRDVWLGAPIAGPRAFKGISGVLGRRRSVRTVSNLQGDS